MPVTPAVNQTQSQAVRVAVVPGLAGLEAVLPEWLELAAEAGNSPLFGPDWIRAQVKAFEPEQAFYLVCARRQGRLSAVLPLVQDWAWFRGLRLRRLRSASGHLCLRFDVTAGSDWSETAETLWDFLAKWRCWSVLELRHVGRSARAWSLQAAAARAGYPVARWSYCESPYLDPMSHTNGSKFRRELLRTRRQLEERGRVRLVEHAKVETARLQGFFELEAAGWKGGPGGNAVLTGVSQLRRFYEELASGMYGKGELVIHHLLCGERAVAMSLGVRHCASYSLVKWVYDESYAHYGPGHLLIDALLPECRAASQTFFDFCGETSAAKRKWTSQSLPIDWLFIYRRNLWGRTAHWLKSQGTVPPMASGGNESG